MDWKELDRELAGNVESTAGMRGAYATDASVYQVLPQAVAFPKSHDDVRAIVSFCRTHEIPIVGRGAGTSLSGQAIGAGLIVDFSRYMNRVISIDPERQLAVVEPGVVLDELNAKLASLGLLFPPDPATASRATIGGMIGNNACGTRSIVFGRTCDSIESLTCVLSDGESFATEWLDAAAWHAASENTGVAGRLCAGVSRLVDEYRQPLRDHIPHLPRIAAGYGLQRFLDPQRPRSLSDLIVGGEGTLALATQATVRLQPLPRGTALVVSRFASVDAALRVLPDVLRFGPSAVELLDEVLVGEALRNASTRDWARVIAPGGKPIAVLLVEFFGDDAAGAAERSRAFTEEMTGAAAQGEHRILTSPAEQKQAWEVRRLGLGLISNLPGKAKSIALIEDACIPIERLPEYNRFVYEQGERLGMGISAYAHASVGVLHYKVMLDLHQAEDRRKMRGMAEACFEKCLEVGGVFSGEHGDGIVRGEFLRRQFGPEVYRAFGETKRLFDPVGLLNPGRKIDAPPLDRLLRYGDDETARQRYLRAIADPPARFRYGEQGSIVGAIEQCNGVGACRQMLKGTMCPSYRATLDERDSTRGRANLFRLAISGQLQPPGLANPDLHAALDLCLACKACKSECPNAVDMARLKSEALQIRWDAEGVPRSAAFLANMPQALARAAMFARGFGWLLNRAWVRRLLEGRYGIDARRPLPRPAGNAFAKWWRENAARQPQGGRPVALFVDAWNRFLEPEIGIAAIELLWSCGFSVQVLRGFDALRTRISLGLLDEARDRAESLWEELASFAHAGLPILCLEPSEASALIDDLPDLVRNETRDRQISPQIKLLDDFLADEIAAGRLRMKKRVALDDRPVLVHPHCHQRALFRSDAPQVILESAGYSAATPDLGCCGMAGSFGYTHFEWSRRIAEQKFLPAIRRAMQERSLVVATGTSCRQQARDLGPCTAVHWVQIVQGVAGAALKP